MNRKQLVLMIWALLVMSSRGWCRDRVLMHLSFDDKQNTVFKYGQWRRRLVTKDIVSGASFRIAGLAEYTSGVSGTALKFDGFSSYVEGVPFVSSEDHE